MKAHYLWKPEKFRRTGTCNTKRCQAMCCRVLVQPIDNTDKRKLKFYEGFGKIKTLRDNLNQPHKCLIIQKDCKYLNLVTLKCKRYKKRPCACKLFPIIYDESYLYCKNICSYKFNKSK